MENKYKINQKVICGSQKCVVIATKLESHKPTVDVFHRKELFPENDYLLFILKSKEPEEYLGILDVFESQIEDVEW